ncbi:response regulator [candidate division KSB1 bacterium]|nr:response regulator [candidate division KSB1 bacterium]MBL7093171.1 response regulator [candidate division KSB1 bacterium]
MEDNEDVRNYIRQHLEATYLVDEAENGKLGVDSALNNIPDLIISDVMMPNMDGYELCRILKNNIKTSHIPIILLTAKASDEYKIEGLETGADDYLIKPFNSEELLVRIKNLVNLRQKLQEKYRRDLLLEPTEVTVESMENEFLRHASEIVEQHLSDPEFSIEQFAKSLFMTRANLHRKLRALTDLSPSQFTRSIRLKRAAQLLKQHSATITEIAFDVGFSSSAYFTKCFKEQYGLTPHQYQNIS